MKVPPVAKTTFNLFSQASEYILPNLFGLSSPLPSLLYPRLQLILVYQFLVARCLFHFVNVVIVIQEIFKKDLYIIFLFCDIQ